MPDLTHALSQYGKALTAPAPRARLGAFVNGAFRMAVASDPSRVYIRHPDNTPATAKHHGRVDLTSTDPNVWVVLGKDAQGYLAVIQLDSAPSGAKLQASPSAAGNYDPAALHNNIAGEIAALPNKATPTTSDLLPINDAADSNKIKYIAIGALPGGTPSAPPYARIENRQSAGTKGGSATNGAWTQAPLNNKISDAESIATLSSNQVTPISGTYSVCFLQRFYRTDASKCRFYNVTDGVEIARGDDANASSTFNTPDSSTGGGRFTTDGTKVYELQYLCITSEATDGLGYGQAIISDPEVYARVELTKFA